jgi:hypothetical protein
MNDAKLGKKDGRRAQILSLEHKLLCEIHPWCYARAQEKKGVM